MAFFDKLLDELKTYKPKREEPPDFDTFWKLQSGEFRAQSPAEGSWRLL